jgi:hypothetical protein
LTVLVRENPVAPVVAVSLMVKTGHLGGDADQQRHLELRAAVMVRGTAQRSGSQLGRSDRGLGGKISASGEVDYSEIRASALSALLARAAGVHAELALTPKLAPESSAASATGSSAGSRAARQRAVARVRRVFATLTAAPVFAAGARHAGIAPARRPRRAPSSGTGDPTGPSA